MSDSSGSALLLPVSRSRESGRDNTASGGVHPGTAARAQTGRDRVRENRLKAAQDRRLQLDPDQVAPDKRLDEATVDVEVAWEARSDRTRGRRCGGRGGGRWIACCASGCRPRMWRNCTASTARRCDGFDRPRTPSNDQAVAASSSTAHPVTTRRPRYTVIRGSTLHG
jgi:hypothetical protein